ncbi:hypothetical protein JOM56_013184 [Amanita muscaria]
MPPKNSTSRSTRSKTKAIVYDDKSDDDMSMKSISLSETGKDIDNVSEESEDDDFVVDQSPSPPPIGTKQGKGKKSISQTPIKRVDFEIPITPTSLKKTHGVKRTFRETSVSDNEVVIVPLDTSKKQKTSTAKLNKPYVSVTAAGKTQKILQNAVEKIKVEKAGQSSSSPNNKKSKASMISPNSNALESSVVIKKTSETKIGNTVYLENLYNTSSSSKLPKCGVFDPKLADPKLLDTYKDLPKLQSGEVMKTWSKQIGNYVFLSNIAKSYGYDFNYLKTLITFQEDAKNNLVNLARVNPDRMAFQSRNSDKSSTHLTFRGHINSALCISFGLSVEDFTHEPQPSGTGRNGVQNYAKLFSMVPLSLEMERQIAAIAIIAGVDFFHAQSLKNGIVFSTQLGPLGFSTPSSSPTKNKGWYSTTQSPSVQTASSSFTTSLLTNADNVPIYDAQNAHLLLPADFHQFKELSPFEGRVPCNSIVMVVYTLGTYRASSHPTEVSISQNIQWVAVLRAGESQD